MEHEGPMRAEIFEILGCCFRKQRAHANRNRRISYCIGGGCSCRVWGASQVSFSRCFLRGPDRASTSEGHVVRQEN
jgi:hypothetical protein